MSEDLCIFSEDSEGNERNEHGCVVPITNMPKSYYLPDVVYEVYEFPDYGCCWSGDAQLIVECLVARGFEVEWNGDQGRRIAVKKF